MAVPSSLLAATAPSSPVVEALGGGCGHGFTAHVDGVARRRAPAGSGRGPVAAACACVVSRVTEGALVASAVTGAGWGCCSGNRPSCARPPAAPTT